MEKEESEEDGAQRGLKHGTYFVPVRNNACMRMRARVWTRDGFGARKKDEEGTGVERRVGGRGSGRWETESEKENVARRRPSPISILIELNATSYLMPETRQKLQLNGDAISLYLPVHSS